MARAVLRVYLGAAPGVGKTVAMLDEGNRRAERGTDVVVAFVEVHGRARTQDAIGVLEGSATADRHLPRYAVHRDGRRGRDRPAPQARLVDELAHTNVPGVRHQKR